MSKYISTYADEAAYTADASRGYPNISLIEATGSTHMSVFPGEAATEAKFGDILCENSSGSLIAIDPSTYSSDSTYSGWSGGWTTRAICIAEKGTLSHGNAVFMLIPGLTTSAGQSSDYGYGDDLRLGFTSYYSYRKDALESSSNDSAAVFEAMKNYVSMSDYADNASIPNGSSSGDVTYNSPAMRAAYNFHTPAMGEKQWYLPSYYDLTQIFENREKFSATLTVLRNKYKINNDYFLIKSITCAGNATNNHSWVPSGASQSITVNKPPMHLQFFFSKDSNNEWKLSGGSDLLRENIPAWQTGWTSEYDSISNGIMPADSNVSADTPNNWHPVIYLKPTQLK